MGLISGLHLRACSKSTAQESTWSCQDKGLPLLLGFSTFCRRHKAGEHFWTSLLSTCKTWIATVNQNSNEILAKHTELLLGGWRVKTGGVCVFGFVQLKGCSYHWERMWTGASPSVFSLFAGRDVAFEQQNLRIFPIIIIINNNKGNNPVAMKCTQTGVQRFASSTNFRRRSIFLYQLQPCPSSLMTQHHGTQRLSQKYHIHLQGHSSSEEARNLGIIRKYSFENIFSYHILVIVSSPFFTWISTSSFKSGLLCFISIQWADLFMGKSWWFLFFLDFWGT